MKRYFPLIVLVVLVISSVSYACYDSYTSQNLRYAKRMFFAKEFKDSAEFCNLYKKATDAQMNAYNEYCADVKKEREHERKLSKNAIAEYNK